MTILPKTKKIYLKDRDRQTGSSNIPLDRHKPPPPRKTKKHYDKPAASLVGQPPTKRALRAGCQSPNVNSDDEYGPGFKNEELEVEFAQRLRDIRGFEIKEMQGDGSCMFRAVADQVYGDEDMHGEVRRLCMDYMDRNRDHFSQFITEDFDEYVARKREPVEHGNHVEMQAISEMYARPVEIYEYSEQPINIFHPTASAEMNAPLRLSYHGSVHYNSVVDPFAATIGVGLGLPGHEPGSAEKRLVADAIRQSDTIHLEETMLNDKLHMTDWQRTEEDLKDQVSRESYIEYVKSLERGVENRKKSPTRKEVHSSAESRSPKSKRVSERSDQIASEPKNPPHMIASCSRDSSDIPSTSRVPGLYEELLAMGAYSDWVEGEEEDAMIAQAVLLSQQQFMEDLRREDRAGSSRQ